MRKKAFLIGLIFLLLAAIPTTVFLVKRQQELRGRAAPATTISFEPVAKTVRVGETFSLNVMMDTGENSATNAEIHFTFDPNKLTATEIKPGSFMPHGIDSSIDNTNGVAFIFVDTLSGVALPKKSNGPESAAVITFKAKADTGTTPTNVGFSQETVAYGETAGTLEPTNLILASSLTNVARITVSAAALTPTPTPTLPPGVTPTPIPTLPPGVTPTPTPLAQNQPPTCTSLSVSPATGNTPLTVTLTANAADPNNDVLAALFTFGDGQTQTVDKNVGQSGSFQVSHVYTSVGNIGANAMVRDRDGAWSTACTASITVAAAGVTPMAGGPIATPTPPPTAPTAVPTLPVSGDIGPTTFLAIAGAALSIIGALLFFAL